MNDLLSKEKNEKKGKVIYLQENLLEIGIGHQDGYTTLYLDVHDIPADLRLKLTDGDEDTFDQLEAYLDDYYTNAEVDSVSLVRGDDFNNTHHWEDIFSCCGIIRGLIVKAKGKMVRAINAI